MSEDLISVPPGDSRSLVASSAASDEIALEVSLRPKTSRSTLGKKTSSRI